MKTNHAFRLANKVKILFFCVFATFCFALESQNPYLSEGLLINSVFPDEKISNSIRIEFSTSLASDRRYFNSNLIYSQPNRIFKLPGRINFEVGGFFTPPHQAHIYNFAIIGISEDVIFPIYPSKFGNLFLGFGIGLYLKSKIDDRIGSAITFGERLFLGYMIENYDIELYYKHYSNGTLQIPNSGHDLWGIAFGYCF